MQSWIKFSFAGILTLSFWLISCSGDDRKDIRGYYFPIDNLEEGMVYEYKAVNNDSLAPNYWYYKSVPTDSGTFFIGNFYDPNLVVRQFFREEVVDNGCLMTEYFLYDVDSTGLQKRFPAEVLAPNSFPFMVRDSGGIFLFKLQWTFSEEPLKTTTLIRNRRYIGTEKFPYKGEMRDCVAFQLKELVDDYDEGHFEQQYSGVELYAKGIGLVYYKKEINKNLSLEYELADIYPMKTLEEKLNIKTTE